MMKPTYLLCLALALAACGRAQNIGQPPKLTSPRQTAEFIAMTNPPLEIPVDFGPPRGRRIPLGRGHHILADQRSARLDAGRYPDRCDPDRRQGRDQQQFRAVALGQ